MPVAGRRADALANYAASAAFIGFGVWFYTSASRYHVGELATGGPAAEDEGADLPAMEPFGQLTEDRGRELLAEGFGDQRAAGDAHLHQRPLRHQLRQRPEGELAGLFPHRVADRIGAILVKGH